MTAQTLRVGIIGVGMMGADHAARIAERTAGARLVVVADPDTARAEQLAQRFDGVRSVEDPLALVADPEVDAVLVASPGFAHEEQVLACIEHGKPVLCEKPLTMDSASSLRIVEAEQRSRRSLVTVGFMRRYDPEYAVLRGIITGGDLGRALVLHNVHRNQSVPESFRTEMIVRDSLVHEVDCARFLLGEEITAIGVRAPRPTSLATEGVLDPQLAMFEMAGGALVDTEVFVNAQVGYEVRCEAVLERGNVTIGLGSGPFTRTAGRWGGVVPTDFRVRFAQAYDREVQSWVDAARTGILEGANAWDGYAANAWDGYAAVAVCEAGVEAVTTGKTVPVAMVKRSELLAITDPSD